jgi:hypothetical protein
MSLRNYIVIIVHYLGSVKKSNLQKRVISNVNNFMGPSLPPNDIPVNNIETETPPSV